MVKWDFIVEVYHLSADEEVKNEGCIATGGGRCYSTPSIWFSIVGISPNMTPGEDLIAMMDTEQADLVAAKGTKFTQRKWVKNVNLKLVR